MQIPLFPLHTVLAPGIALPLHVFEERYRALVRRCLDTSSPFGVVLIREGSEVAPSDGRTQELSIAGVGTLAEIREASKYADGRWDVLCVGTTRFVVHEVHAGVAPYLVADVAELVDDDGDPAEADALVDRVTRRFVDYLRLLEPRDGETAAPIDVQMEVEVADEEGFDDDDDAADDADDAGDDAAFDPSGDAAGFDDDEAEDEDDEDRVGPTLVVSAADPIPLHDPEATRAALRIPDEPSALSFLLTGILQVEPDRKQALLEAASAQERLRDIDELLDRELVLLAQRLAPFAVDRRVLSGSTN